MLARFDRVIRRGAAGGRNVYSLCLNSDGLYVFLTGVVGGLVLDDADDEPRQIIVNEQTLPLIESMIKNEARAHSVPPEELVLESGHTLILFNTIRAVRQDHSALMLDTARENFSFYFTLSKDLEVSELADRLRHSAEESHADD